MVVLKSKDFGTLKERVQKKTTVLLIHAEWCGHCRQFAPEWEEFCKSAGRNVQTLSIESEELKKLVAADKALAKYLTQTPSSTEMYFPKIMIFRKTGKTVRRAVYQGERTAEALKAAVA